MIFSVLDDGYAAHHYLLRFTGELFAYGGEVPPQVWCEIQAQRLEYLAGGNQDDLCRCPQVWSSSIDALEQRPFQTICETSHGNYPSQSARTGRSQARVPGIWAG